MAKLTIDELRASVHGQVITADDTGYDEARAVWSGADRKPKVVVRPSNAGDVIQAVGFARENALDLSVRCGGHSAPGYGTNDGGVVIDLSLMRGVRVDPFGQTARAEGGALIVDVLAATDSFGMTAAFGIIGTTGIGGLSLGGGSGHLSRGFGLTIDNIISMDVVTADGRFLVASDKENEDLYWALRGGSGNFGVVTSFEYQLHPVKDIYAGVFFYPIEETRSVLEFYRDYIVSAPEEMGLFPGFQIAPPLPFIPEEHHGKTFVIMAACWAGPLDKGEKALAPIQNVAPRVGELVTPMPMVAFNTAFDALYPAGMQHYWKGSFATDLSDEAIAVHMEHGPKVPVMQSTMHIYSINGAVHRVPSDATAFAHRDATYSIVIAGMNPEPSKQGEVVSWVKDYAKALEPYTDKGGYINFQSEDDQDRVKENYRGNFERLAQIKKKYDPGNLFHVNHNIKPA
jgi:FAD/FMN-containing dehydrogenase